MYFWKYILAKKAGLSQKKCNMALCGLPVLPIAEAFEKTVTGNPISVSDALAQDALSLQVSFTPTQDGTPSIDSEPTTEPYLNKVIPRGNKEYYSLVGGTVAWNQLVQITDFVSVTYGGITGTNNGDGTYTVNGRARDLFDVYRNYELTANHVYFAMGCPQGGDPYTYRLALASKIDKGSGLIYKSEYGGNETLAISISNGTEVNNLVFRPQLCDLTALFGSSTIADYIYSLEQATEGAGVQWLKDNGFFTRVYYPYNPGELISVNTSGKKIVGFNQWDEEWEVGLLSPSTGGDYQSNKNIRSKNYIPVFPNTVYYFNSPKSTGNGMFYYDGDKSFIINQTISTAGTFTTPANCYYLRFDISSTYGKTYHDDICINISDPQKNGMYKPYVEHTYPIDNIDLRGLFKLSNGKLYCEGDTYPPSGNVSRKRKRINLGDLNWRSASQDYSFMQSQVPIDDIKAPSLNTSIADIITTSLLPTSATAVAYSSNGNGVAIKNDGYCRVRYDNMPTDPTGFKNAMNGVYMEYELLAPTTESATPYASPTTVEAGGTEEFIDNRTVPIPVGNETYYASEYEIHGKTGVTVSHGATQDDPNPTEYEVEFTSQGTVYGGTVDIVSGELSVTWGYIASYNGETLTGIWMSSKDVYTEGTTPSTGAEVAYELATPQTYQLTPQQVQMLLGNNCLETEDGTITLTYMAGK